AARAELTVERIVRAEAAFHLGDDLSLHRLGAAAFGDGDVERIAGGTGEGDVERADYLHGAHRRALVGGDRHLHERDAAVLEIERELAGDLAVHGGAEIAAALHAAVDGDERLVALLAAAHAFVGAGQHQVRDLRFLLPRFEQHRHFGGPFFLDLQFAIGHDDVRRLVAVADLLEEVGDVFAQAQGQFGVQVYLGARAQLVGAVDDEHGRHALQDPRDIRLGRHAPAILLEGELRRTEANFDERALRIRIEPLDHVQLDRIRRRELVLALDDRNTLRALEVDGAFLVGDQLDHEQGRPALEREQRIDRAGDAPLRRAGGGDEDGLKPRDLAGAGIGQRHIGGRDAVLNRQRHGLPWSIAR